MIRNIVMFPICSLIGIYPICCPLVRVRFNHIRELLSLHNYLVARAARAPRQDATQLCEHAARFTVFPGLL